MRKREPENVDIDQLRKLGYETRDVSLDVLVKWGIGLIIFALGSALAAFLLYVLFLGENPLHPPLGTETQITTPRPYTMSQRLPPPPYPLLQGHPVRDIQEYRAQEDRRMTTPAWEDRTGGFVRIPVSQAMSLVADQGLPARPNAAANADSPAPGDYLAPESGQPVRPDTPQTPAALPMGSTMAAYQSQGPSSGRADLTAPGPATQPAPTPPAGPAAAARPDMTGRVAPGAGGPPNPPGTPTPTTPKPGEGANRAPSSNPSNQQTRPTPGINK